LTHTHFASRSIRIHASLEGSVHNETAPSNSQIQLNHPKDSKGRLGLITFDLDDTLFPIAQVIEDANAVLLTCMHQLGYNTVTRDGLITTTENLRSELDRDNSTGIIRYTDLRKLAIQHEMIRHCCGQQHIEAIRTKLVSPYQNHVEEVYGSWENERHASAERNIYPGVIPMLQQLRRDHPDATIGAITNGKGNPLKMHKTLSPYFEFCVSGEDDGVFPYRKPHRNIYEAALKKYADALSLTEKKRNVDGQNRGTPPQTSPCVWMHVGDDLSNDVGASATCGAKAIWVDLAAHYDQTAAKRLTGLRPAWSTASSEEMARRKITAERAREVSVTARVQDLYEIPKVVADIVRSL